VAWRDDPIVRALDEPHADDSASAVDNNSGTASSTSCTSTARDRHRFFNYGITLPSGLRESDRLPQPIFTPATKADTGHDINIGEKEAAERVGRRVLDRVRDLTLRLYAHGSAHAESCGIIVADTKFEFGLLPIEDGDDSRPVEDRVILIDEVLTPDSSRFWPRDAYHPGGAQPSFDKQFVRDYLERIKWNKQPPVPTLPDDVVAKTRDKYVEAFRRLTGRELE